MAADDPSEELREAARHRGLKLVKSRRRKAGGDFGRFGLTDAGGAQLLGFGADGLTATAEDIAAYLRKGAAATWAASARATPARKTSAGRTPPPAPRAGTSRPTGRGVDTEARPATRSTRQANPEPQLAPVLEEIAAEPEPSPPPALTVRTARTGDVQAIAALIGSGPDAIATYPRTKLLVAERGAVIGCGAWHVVPTLQHGPIGRISLIFVAPHARRQGVGTALVQAARAALDKQGCAVVEAMSDIDLRNAHGFFRTLGFKQASYRFTLD